MSVRSTHPQPQSLCVLEDGDQFSRYPGEGGGEKDIAGFEEEKPFQEVPCRIRRGRWW